MADDEVLSVDTANEEEDEREIRVDEHMMLRRLKSWLRGDAEKRHKWIKEADRDFEFVASKQWSKEDEDFMKRNDRVPVVFNRCLTVIKSIAGSEINGRLQVAYKPRGREDTKVNELLSAASDWMGDECDAEDEQSEAFESALICGEGWSEGRVDYEENPQGKYIEEEIDPREIVPDKNSRKKNYADARRLFRLKSMCLTEARALFPDVIDQDLDAKWATSLMEQEAQTPKPVEEKDHTGDIDDVVEADASDVTIVHAMWFEKEKYWLVALEPTPEQLMMGGAQQEPESLSDEEYKTFDKRAKAAGIAFHAAPMLKRVYKHCFIGRKILDGIHDSPFQEGFAYNAITGERDRSCNQFFGIVRVMRDPQMWANKMLSNVLHIANTTAKGGIIAEKDAFENQQQAEESYAQPNVITWAKQGSVANGKIIPKPGQGDPSTYIKLLEFAIASIRDVTGVNMELLGLRDANQPGILEAQRKQAAMTVLASLFNSLRRFRKGVGRHRLFIIQNYFSDGRLIRLVGQNGAESLPLLKDQTMGEYDVEVADAPTSPNQKEQNWLVIQQMLPTFKDMITPEVALEIMTYSPLPSEIVDTLREIYQKNSQQQAQQQQVLTQQQQQVFDANLKKLFSEAAKNFAAAQKTSGEAQVVGANVEVERAKGMAEAQNVMIEGHANAQKAAADAENTRVQGQVDAQKGMADVEATRAKTQSQQMLDAMSLKQMMAEIAQTQTETMMAMIDQKFQQLQAVQSQAHEQSLAERALAGQTALQATDQASKNDRADREFEMKQKLAAKAANNKNKE